MHPDSKSNDSTPPNTPLPLCSPLLAPVAGRIGPNLADRTRFDSGFVSRQVSLDSGSVRSHFHLRSRRSTTGERMADERLVVWYNTRCPVCDAGINRQRNKLIAAVEAGTIEFRDINLEPAALAAYGASLDDVRRRLHATDAAGRLIGGADVAVAVWRLTPGARWIGGVRGSPVVR